MVTRGPRVPTALLLRPRGSRATLRSPGKPIPQTKDALFWRVEAEKVQVDSREEEHTDLRIWVLPSSAVSANGTDASQEAPSDME